MTPMKKKKSNQNRQIPENELLEAIEIITKKLAYKFKFGYHDIEDMKQQISIFAIEGLKNYDHERPLENFLWTHVRNRLYNYKRDNYQRPDKPCLGCEFYDKHFKNSSNQCLKFTDKTNCNPFHTWESRNTSKKNLMKFTTIEDLKEYLPIKGNAEFHSENLEIIQRLQDELSGVHREIFLRFINGSKVNKLDLEKLLYKIKEIIDV
jgi:DNA-directed RNA polymerase specialized sigma24 family protein